MRLLRPSVMRRSEWDKDRDQAHWKRVKTQVLARDQDTCVYCQYSSSKFMQVNHIGAEDNHEIDNLETVCRACHSVLHLGISAMHGALTVFECKPEGENVATIVAHTRSLVAKHVDWTEIERQILERFAQPGGKVCDKRQSVSWANKMLHTIAPDDYRGYLPDGLSVCFHEEGEWNGFPEITWKWQCMQGSGYRRVSP